MAKKQETNDNLIKEVNNPRYLSNRPKGADLFEGKSQERLAQTVATHIIETDKEETPLFSRLIGLQGKWGSGKSNVIKMLEEELNKKGDYTFFSFDAWGNQEDLQRRSILELLTRHLITKEILTGKTSLRVMKPEGDGKIEEIECTWPEKLGSLLSRKSYSRNITVPSLNNWTKVFVLMLLITGLLIPLVDVVAKDLCPWAQLSIILVPMIVFLIIAGFKKKLPVMWKMYNTEGKSDTMSYVISEQEPSVREFKEWMTEVSKSIPIDNKLVIVFDNMDRLPSEKVHQFWSLIQTFFADDGYKNIWCIVPFDENHLASVFSDEQYEDKSVELLRHYLDKTFPVVYRVPEPIVADYKILFETLFRDAFGNTVDDDSLVLISQCYRHANPIPNVREIISFINNTVLLTKQWKDAISPISRAVFVLKEDAMIRNPKVTIFKQNQLQTMDASTDEYILANEYYRDFRQILIGNVDVPTMQREMAAMVYGIAPERADQIVIKRYIRNCFNGEAKEVALTKYATHPLFMLLLLEDVMGMSVSEYEKAVQLIKDIDIHKLQPQDQKRLAKIWRFLGGRYTLINFVAKEYAAFEHTLFSNVGEEMAKKCVATFCRRLIDNTEVDGTTLYDQLNKIFGDIYAKSFDAALVCPSVTLEAKRYADFVQRAGADYKRFPLKANKDDLNKAIEEAISDRFPYLNTLKLLKEDKDYTVLEVGKYAVEKLNLKKVGAPFASNLIAIQRVFYDSFQSTLDTEYVNTLWQGAQTEEGKASYEEIYALKAVDAFEQLPADERHINILMDKILFYASTANLFKTYLSNVNINFRRNLLREMIGKQKHDGIPDYPDFVGNWQPIVSGLGINRDDIVLFADSWGYKALPKEIDSKQYFTILGDVDWIDTLLAVQNDLSKALITKCVSDMSKQNVEQFIQPSTVTHTNTNWDKALKKLISTPYINESSFPALSSIACTLLDYVARVGPINDTIWNALLGKVSYSTISSQFTGIRNNILNGVGGYAMNPAKFQVLHVWLEQSGINAESHCSDAASQILAKVVDDVACQSIILEQKDYYDPIIAKTKDTASALHDCLKRILDINGDSDFAVFIRECVNYGGGGPGGMIQPNDVSSN